MNKLFLLFITLSWINFSIASDFLPNDDKKGPPLTKPTQSYHNLADFFPLGRPVSTVHFKGLSSSSTGKPTLLKDGKRAKSSRHLRTPSGGSDGKLSTKPNLISREPSSFDEYIHQTREVEQTEHEFDASVSYAPLTTSSEFHGKRRHAYLPRCSYHAVVDDHCPLPPRMTRRARSRSAHDLKQIVGDAKNAREIWTENVEKKFETIVLRMKLEQFDKPDHQRVPFPLALEDVEEEFLRLSVQTTSARRLLAEASAQFPHDKFNYLRTLLSIKDVREFLAEYKKLKKAKKHVNAILGVNLKFIKEMGAKTFFERWHERLLEMIRSTDDDITQTDIIREINLGKRAFKELDAPFNLGFDGARPIQYINVKDVAESFRSFLATSEIGKTEYFQINGQSFAIPDLQGTKESKRPYAFLARLLDEIENMGLNTKTANIDDILEEMRTFALPDNDALLDFFASALNDFIKPNEKIFSSRRFGAFLIDRLASIPSSHRMALHDTILREASDCESYLWRELDDIAQENRAQKIVDRLTSMEIHNRFQNQFASYHLMGTLSINAFSPAEKWLRSGPFSSVSHSDVERPQIKKDPEDLVEFSIDVDAETGDFTLTRRYIYTLKLNRVALGKFTFAWDISGNVNKPQYRGRLRGIDVLFSNSCPLYVQYFVAQHLRDEQCFDFFQ